MNKLIQEIKEIPTGNEGQNICKSDIVYDLQSGRPMANIVFAVSLMQRNASQKNKAFLDKLSEVLTKYNTNN